MSIKINSTKKLVKYLTSNRKIICKININGKHAFYHAIYNKKSTRWIQQFLQMSYYQLSIFF